ncbi:MAG: DNA repair protein RecO [Alphaproteobacteria bacterium]
MEWTDRGTVLGVRRHGETSIILELMTEKRGRHLGLVRGGRSRKLQPVLQPGNDVTVTWRARLDEHLGTMTVEPLKSRAADIMQDRLALSALQMQTELLRLLPEREPNTQLFTALQVCLEHLNAPSLLAELLIRLELAVLEELGFGLDLHQCVQSGSNSGLIYVSPKSGRAVGAAAGEPYKDLLLPLPQYLTLQHAATAERSHETLSQGFALSQFFLQRHVYRPRGIQISVQREEAVRLILAAVQRSG